jgi:hypothetical protein
MGCSPQLVFNTKSKPWFHVVRTLQITTPESMSVSPPAAAWPLEPSRRRWALVVRSQRMGRPPQCQTSELIADVPSAA